MHARGRLSGFALGLLTLALLLLPLGGAPSARAADLIVASAGETAPGTHAADSIDDPAIWVAPDDPARSLIIGNDKLGALASYDLQGNLVQRIVEEGVFFGNVDVRQNVTIAGRTRDIVAVSHRNLTFYAIDPVTRRLSSITEGTGVGLSGEGLCLAKDRHTGALSVVHITIAGQLRQFAITDTDRDGLLEAMLTRDVAVGSEAEGCVVNDVTGDLFVAQEDVAIWRYDIDPATAGQRIVVAAMTDPTAHLVPDIEGLTLAVNAAGEGYLFASAQNVADPDNSYFVAFRATGGHDVVTTFRVGGGPNSDDCDRTDGITAYAGSLGPAFPYGMFVCQDNNNDAPGVGNQDFKMVRLEQIIGVLPVGNPPPVARATVSCTGTSCTFNAAASTDDSGIASYAWAFGDSGTAAGVTATHLYAAAGTYHATLTVTDTAGASDRITVPVTIGIPPATFGFVAQSASPNSNATRFALTLPSGIADGDLLVLSFATAAGTVTTTGPGAGWTERGRASDAELMTTLWTRVATASDAGRSVSVSTASLVKGVLGVAAYRGIDRQNPIVALAAAAHTAADSTSHPSGVVSTGVPALRVSLWATKSATITRLTPPAAESTRAASNGSGSGRITTVLSDSATTVPAGTNGGLLAVSDAATGKALGWTVMLRPAGESGQPPVAAFTRSCLELTCSFDATGSTDPDGTIAAYDWNFGDESSGSGVTISHGFAAAGSYPVTLTVRDNTGLVADVTVVVTVSSPATPVVDFVAAAISPSRNATTYQVTVPSAVRAGDTLILVRSVANSAPAASGPGADWHQLGTTADDLHATSLWWRIATAADPGTSISISTGTSYVKGTLSLLAYRGADATNPVGPWAGSPVPSLSTGLLTPSLTVTEPGLRLSIWTARTSTITSITPPATELVRVSGYGSGSAYVASVISDGTPPPAPSGPATLGGLTASANAATDQGSTWTVLLRPAP